MDSIKVLSFELKMYKENCMDLVDENEKLKADIEKMRAKMRKGKTEKSDEEEVAEL